ncbi:MAG: HU family DNA-binding protein [Bacteroidetes bacterium]|nr:HU family DNA-binding protein [Bacteroidota bacterium]MBL6943679.1 HU family DNA-binding protein [Bacteroidales bacterium]
MTSSEIIKNLSLRLGKSQLETKQLIKSSTEIIRDILDKNINISLPGLGTLSRHFVKKKKSYDPFHKWFIMSPPKRVIRFRPGSSIKNEFKSKKV